MTSFTAGSAVENSALASIADQLLALPSLGALIMAATLMLGFGHIPAQAQEVTGPAYAVTYIEVIPKETRQVIALLRAVAAQMRKKPGSLSYIALERDNPVNHFAVVESWKDRSAYETAQASEERKTFLKALAPLLSAPVDERPHVALSTDQSRTQSAVAASGPAAVFVVTHVDVIPTKKDEGIAATKSLFAPSSAEKGNSAFDVLQQASRANHMTLFEIWKDRTALETHQSSDFVRAYRQTLQPASGALYDQRTYRLLK